MRIPGARHNSKIVEEDKDVITFLGLNKLPVISKGQLRAMTNMSSRYPGCLYPRGPRTAVATLTAGWALCSTNSLKLCYVDGTSFYYDGVLKGTVTASAKSMVDFGGVVLIFPDKKYYNYITTVFGTIGTGSPADGEAPAAGQCPNMDMVCVFNNRAWGIKGRTVYGSKYNDPLTWGQFSVPVSEADSVYFKISMENGDLNGIIPLENHIEFSGKSSLYEMYGNKPSNYIPREITGSKGAIDGKSMVEIDGSVFMLCADGINRYSGSYPRLLSMELDETYSAGKAGTDGRKYYISLYNGSAYNLYVYDTLTEQWHREDTLQVKDFALMDGSLYALASDNKIYRFNYGTESFSWEIETDQFTEQYMGKKATSQITIEANIETTASIQVSIKINNGAYVLWATLTTTGYTYHKIDSIPQEAFSFQMKLTGSGIAKIYSITRDKIIGTDI